jgi:hypothetical protein
MDLVDLVKETLDPLGVPVQFLERPKSAPCISFHFFNESGTLYGDGKPVVNGGMLQLDIFHTKSPRTLRAQAIAALTSRNGPVGFVKTFPDECRREPDAGLYHQVIVLEFYYNIKSGVM